jgi:hypothetical protein
MYQPESKASMQEMEKELLQQQQQHEELASSSVT